MAAVLGTNIASIWASKNLQSAQTEMAKSVERLSSGLRINRASDDAAGLGIANALTQQINGANQGVRNLNDGISIVQTAEGAINAASEMAQRVLTLATQGANGSMSSSQTDAIKAEMRAILTSMSNIQTRTTFSGFSLLGASSAISIKASSASSDTISIDSTVSLRAIFDDTGTTSAAEEFSESIASASFTTFSNVIDKSNAFITSLDTQRASLGALQNQMEYAVSNVTELSANLTAARSRVIDTDYASETASLTKGQILQQAATAMLAQANQMPNVILSLLK
jgi:flagellin